MNQVLGLVDTEDDLVQHPEKALEPQIGYRILAYGMKTGTFTGQKLTDYITDNEVDYVNARRTINLLNQAHKIANDAEKFEIILRESLASSGMN